MSDDVREPHNNPRFVGGEMSDWHDPSPDLGPLSTLLRPTLRGRVLLLGPSAAGLAESSATDVRVRILVRGTADASLWQSRGVDVICGALDFLPVEPTFDSVIMLDPPELLLGPDSRGMSHTHVLDAASAYLAPGGTFIGLVPNALALQCLRNPSFNSWNAANDAWWVGTEGFDERPPLLSELQDQPSHVVICEGGTPRAVLTCADVGAPGIPALVTSATAPLSRAADAVAGGVGQAIAGDWLVVRGDASALARNVIRGVHSDLVDPPIDRPGRVLARELSDALRQASFSRVRALLTEYDEWLTRLPADERALAVPRNVVLTPAGPRALDDARARFEVSAATAFGRGLRDLATALAGIPGAHPFSPALRPDDLAEQMAALIGRRFDMTAVRALDNRDPLRPPARDNEPAPTRRNAELADALRQREIQLTELRTETNKLQRRVRALEHAIATEHGPRARRALFLMTAPTSRLVEAGRAWVQRR